MRMPTIADLRAAFGERLQENVTLAPYTSARIGGPADALITVKSADELADAITQLWAMDAPYFILGGGSNVLVSDRGVRGVVVLNRAKAVRFETGERPKVRAESGVVFSNLANRCASQGLSGLEWASAIPGTLGGAVYGNAGAFGGDVAGSLIETELLTGRGRETWTADKMEYGYRSSVLKRGAARAVILSAAFGLKNATAADVSATIGQFVQRRKSTQPPGARLVEAAGLKGARVGNAEISAVHGNFFVNHGETKAGDIRALIELVQKKVKDEFGVTLELEIELVGEW
ncbi:MAG: UDP-N-acetylmuramate dehydrogenase [Anaerolineae bacterium]|nr:UDP-N-acetylmuramate dehydrogenase [Anaerolineae bacterium]